MRPVYFMFGVCLGVGIVTFRKRNIHPQEFSQVLNIRSTDIKTIFSSRSLQDHSAKLARLQNETIAQRPVLENVSLARHVSVAITVTFYKKKRRNDMYPRANTGDPGFNRERMMRFAHWA